MQLYYLKGMNPKDVENRWAEHKDWTWMQWQDHWDRTKDPLDFCVALTLEEACYNCTE